LGCLDVDTWAWHAPEFGTGFEAQRWLLPPLPSSLFPLAGRRTSSNPSITLPCNLAPGLNINQSEAVAALIPPHRARQRCGFAPRQGRQDGFGVLPVSSACSLSSGEGGRSVKMTTHRLAKFIGPLSLASWCSRPGPHHIINYSSRLRRIIN